jgi:Fe-Mn family superoxide dismutase
MLRDIPVTDRRDFLKFITAAGGAFAAMHTMRGPLFAVPAEPIEYIPLIKLPYATNALAPHISEKTVKQHYNEHHKAYYNGLKGYIEANKEFADIPLENLIDKTRGKILTEEAIFQFAVLLWNHNFYWQSMKPKGGIAPENQSALTKQAVASFGSVEKFKEKFIRRCMEVGIGWVWLIHIPSGLEVVRSDYHDNFIPTKYPPLLTIDVWEHAYYMDYGPNRQKYVENYLNHLVNWDFAEARFEGLEKSGEKKKK